MTEDIDTEDWTLPVVPEDFIVDEKKEGDNTCRMWLEDHEGELNAFLDKNWNVNDHDNISDWFYASPKMAKALLTDYFRDNKEKVDIIIGQGKRGKSKIILIVGGRGSGKTATALWYAEELQEERECFCIGGSVKEEDLPKTIQTETNLLYTPIGSLNIIDEAGIQLSARESGQKYSLEVTKQLLTARHDDKTVIFMTQHTKISDVNLIRLADIVMFKEPISNLFDTERGSNIKNWLNELVKVLMPTRKEETLFIMGRRIMKFIQPLPSFWSEKLSKSYRGFVRREKDKRENAVRQARKIAQEQAKKEALVPKCFKCGSRDIRYIVKEKKTYCRRCGNKWGGG